MAKHFTHITIIFTFKRWTIEQMRAMPFLRTGNGGLIYSIEDSGSQLKYFNMFLYNRRKDSCL